MQWAVEAKVMLEEKCCEEHDWSSWSEEDMLYMADLVWPFGGRNGPFFGQNLSCFVSRKMHENGYFSNTFRTSTQEQKMDLKEHGSPNTSMINFACSSVYLKT
jgi:hypothetical protein